MEVFQAALEGGKGTENKIGGMMMLRALGIYAISRRRCSGGGVAHAPSRSPGTLAY